MKKVEYLISSFNNVQELIRFTDQKVAAVLVICGIQITVFFERTKGLDIAFSSIGLINVLIFLFGLSFSCLLLIILYLSIFHVLKPGFAKNYSTIDFSCYYFEHIALNDKVTFDKKIAIIDEEEQKTEIRDQIFEVSKILYKKNKNCSIIMRLLFFSIISLVAFVFLGNLL